jgi:hypothetical protein
MSNLIVVEEIATTVVVPELASMVSVIEEVGTTVVVQETSPADIVEIVAVGPQGASGTLAIGSVTTGAPGSSASITNVGTSTDAVLNVVIPRGDTGTLTPELVQAKEDAEAAAAASQASSVASAGSASSANTSAVLAAGSASNAATQATAAANSAASIVGAEASTTAKAAEALASANNAAASASTATTKASEASISATNAAGSATAASSSATAASSSATSAAGSATTATTKAAEATTQANNSQSSADDSADSAVDAAASASAANSSASLAITKAAEATTAATNAASGSLAATSKATEAANSATSAATSATAASNSASSASTSASTATGKATEAQTSATNAAASAATATTRATEASTSATNAATSATGAGTSATSAAGSASAASTSATSASTSAGTATTQAGIATTKAGEAATSATNAASSATTATTKASESATSASSASGSASTATTKAAEALTSASNAATSASQAATSETNAATSATAADASEAAAATSETNAAASASSASTSAATATTKAGEATTSASSASTFATTATTKATEAGNSATAAAGSATSAAGSATTATTQAGNASSSATAAQTAATTATTKAAEAVTSATNAATSATTASNQATAALGSATSAAGSATTATTQAATATTKAGEASTSATNAAASATTATTKASEAASSASAAAAAKSAAETARDQTLSAFDSFDDRYLGQKASDPTVDNDGNALVAGAIYFNTGAIGSGGGMKVYDGTAWLVAYASLAGTLLIANNLSDLNNAATARTNLGLGNVENKSSATIRGELSFSNVTTALGFTPYNAASLSGALAPYLTSASAASTYQPIGSYLTGITSGQVTTALGFTPANKAGDTFTGAVLTSNSGGFTANSAAKLWTDSNRGRLDLYEGSSQSKSLRVMNANGYGIVGMISAENLELWTNGTARVTINGTTGIATFVGNVIQDHASDARFIARVNGVGVAQLQGTANEARLHGVGSVPISLWSDGVKIIEASTSQVTINNRPLVSSNTITGSTFFGSAAGLTGLKTVNGNSILGTGNIQIDGGVTSFNTRTGAVTLSSGDVTTALGFTPYNNSNPAGYITSSALSSYLPLSGGTLTGDLITRGIRVPHNDYELSLGYNGTGNGVGVYFNSGADGVYFYNRTGGANSVFIGRSGGLNVVTGALQQGGNQVLHAGNYNSYSPSLTGSGASGTWSINVTGNANSASTLNSGATINGNAYFRKNQTAGDYGTAALWTESYGNTTTGIAFHISGVVGKFLEMRTNGTLYWNSDIVLHSGNYSSYAVPLGGGTMSGRLTISPGWTTSGRNYSNEWIEFGNYSGLYSTLNGAHFYPNNGTYGGWRSAGSRNGWGGIEFDAGSGNVQLMIGSDSNTTGFHNNNYGWQLRWASGVLHVYKNSYGGGTDAIVLDSSNYTSYSPSLGGSGASGNWNITATYASSLYPQGHGGNASTFGYGRLYNYSSTGAWTNAPSGMSYGSIYNFGGTDSSALSLELAADVNHNSTSSTRYLWFRTGNNLGFQNDWKEIIHSSNYSSYALPLSGGTVGDLRTNFLSGGGGHTFSANHYSMGKDYANGGWSHPHYSDLIIGYHTGIRIGAAYSGIRFYNNSPTTDANNDGNGDGGEALLMTVGGHAGGSDVIINNGLKLSDSNLRLTQASDTALRVTTAYGYLDIGPKNSSWCHIYSDKNIYTNVGIWINNSRVLDAGNYTSYSPSLTGGGASGTWGINVTGNAATATKTTANSGYARVGYGMAPFYNWGGSNAGAGAPSDSTYTTGIDVGSHPSDQAYGFQIASNMWNVGLWTRSYNSGFSGWVRLLDSSNYTSYALPLSGGTMSGTLSFNQPVGLGFANGQYIKDNGGGGLVIYSGAAVNINGSSITINGNTALHSGNYTSYTISTSGGSVNGNTLFYSNNGSTLGGLANPSLQAYATGGNAAFMSFHRGGNYAVNFGLDSDNVLRIGGWSAANNRLQMDMSGNLTMAGNVTAYSDERLKKDWAALPSDFVERLAQIKSGTYTRIDSKERQAGVSAQDFQRLLPETVSEDNEGTLSLAYGNASLTSAVELAKRIVDQEKRIAHLESLISKLIGD